MNHSSSIITSRHLSSSFLTTNSPLLWWLSPYPSIGGFFPVPCGGFPITTTDPYHHRLPSGKTNIAIEDGHWGG